MSKQVYWAGTPPAKCDLCGRQIGDNFVDGRTKQGQWALMDKVCHGNQGFGYGPGRAQRYVKQEDGRWLKVEG